MRRFKRTAEDWAVDTFVYVFVILYALMTLIPFLNIIAKAFSAEWALISGRVSIFPIGFQLHTIGYVIQNSLFVQSFKNSVIVVLLGTVLMVVVTGLAAYPLSKPNLPLRKPLLVIFVFTMLFSGGMIPQYLLMKDLKLTNTLQALFLPGAINVYNMLLIKSYFESLPESLEESARMDGASSFVVLIRIMVPLALPVFATVALFTAVGLWNDYFSPMIYNTQISVKTLSLYLRDVIVENLDDVTLAKTSDEMMNLLPEGVRAATIVASTIPILVVYPFVQKYFIKGVLIGSVKG
ncbi:MAG: carbohydrate ABC transporter permease [Clostridiales bacterium]|jgi:putative aldouronate transport system permease protein|nr:carbohydrate ABC transporter permease [Clostridiales bacterium]